MRKKQEIVMEEITEEVEMNPEDTQEVKETSVKEDNVKETSVKEDNVKETSVKEDNVINIPGVGSATAEKLIGSGYDNLLSLAVASPRELVQIAGVTEVTARKMIQFSREKLNLGFESGPGRS